MAPSNFVVCLRNAGYEASLDRGTRYELLPDAEAAKHRQVRIIDESGEDYLYPESFFSTVHDTAARGANAGSGMPSERRFFERPILNSPYEYPSEHWELDDAGQPTNRVVPERRKVSFITPIPKPRKRRGDQGELVFDAPAKALESSAQQYDLTTFISGVRHRVDRWRESPDPAAWRVTPETARLLQHWRSHRFGDIRPFFCQVEAVETVIWLTEVAPQLGREGRQILDHLADASEQANPGLARLALKLATGAGKTTVMAMIIAWQTINAIRRPSSSRFTRGFLVVTPGVTIRDRLRVLQPNDPDAYYASRELVPGDMLRDLERAKIVITNYHAFMLRERLELSKGGRALLQGSGPALGTKETEGQMLQRVMPGLMGLKRILVLNDEAHHCYREKPAGEDEEGRLKGDDRKEAERNKEAARVWISGLEAVQRKLGLQRVSTCRRRRSSCAGRAMPRGRSSRGRRATSR